MCVEAVESGEKSGNFQEISLLKQKDFESCPSILGCVPVSCGRLGSLFLSKS